MTKRILFVLAAISLAGAGLYYRSANGREAAVQRDKIVQADVAGADVAAELNTLKGYVQTHMGADIMVTLTGAYGRAQAAARVAATASAANSKVYADGQRACAGHSDSLTQARCVTAYVSQRLVGVPAPAPIAEPKLSDYTHNLRAPLWTPDLAGALLLGAALALIFGLTKALWRSR